MRMETKIKTLHRTDAIHDHNTCVTLTKTRLYTRLDSLPLLRHELMHICYSPQFFKTLNCYGARSYSTPASMRRFYFSPPERQQRPHVRHILQRLEHGNQMQKVIVRRVVDPAFDGYRVV